jgi:phosphoribosylanthranilate isomerase
MGNYTKVKICGITNTDDALLAANLGADFIGLNFFKDSARKVSLKNAKEIISKMPPFISSVGVFVDEILEEVIKTAKKAPLKYIQLHGTETPEYCSQAALLTGLPIIKAFRIIDEKSIDALPRYSESVNYFLLDAFVAGEPGGTGQVFNWDIAVKAKEFGKPVFLAGGLTPENIAEAIAKTLPFAVDVAGGVERLERRKDYDKLSRFIRAARGLK